MKTKFHLVFAFHVNNKTVFVSILLGSICIFGKGGLVGGDGFSLLNCSLCTVCDGKC
jgi:hypothetical protein